MNQAASGVTGRTIAVVVPARDARAFITDALESVADQTRTVDRCIVVDDGSTDGTADVVSDWAADHGALPVELLRQEHGGAAAARSVGVRSADTDLVSLLDADDVLLPDALMLLEAGFETWPDLAVCFGDAERFTVGGEVGEDYLAGKPVWRLPHEAHAIEIGGTRLELRRLTGGVFESLLAGSYVANCAALVVREAAMRAGLWSDEFPTVEDRDFWLRLSRLGPFACAPRVVARVRYHGRNLSSARGGSAQATDAARVLQKTLRLADELRLDPQEREAVRAALARAVEQALYAASLDGPVTFRRTITTLDDGATHVPWAKPRHLARAVLSPIIRARRRA